MLEFKTRNICINSNGLPYDIILVLFDIINIFPNIDNIKGLGK